MIKKQRKYQSKKDPSYKIGPKKPAKKKQLGQHFLRKQSVVDHMIDKVKITQQTTVMEIGCGDGFLTKSILMQTKCKKLIVFEIDPQWAEFVQNEIKDPRLEINVENILDVDFKLVEKDAPFVLLANIPYQITFPIMFLLQKNKQLFSEGVVMVQDEVAQKIAAKKGKKYSATSLFLQYHFDFELMEKIGPESFTPAPKVNSRLLYFKPKLTPPKIKDEDEFWKFLKLCFKFPRRTLQNNLKMAHYDLEKITPEILKLRAQQISFDQFLDIWNKLN
ncbi:MAG: 16S rRNA (adenine(1518)-N(6)/adenine(1519)-N(6))-dimethyltransferase RsmA [bacterium]